MNVPLLWQMGAGGLPPWALAWTLCFPPQHHRAVRTIQALIPVYGADNLVIGSFTSPTVGFVGSALTN